MNRGDLNLRWASTLLDELARCGVREVFVAPGSRSAPLVLAVAGDSRFRVTSVLDERSAGFLALGYGKGSGHPAAVITTSGTAGANLFPAVIEASQGEVPLLVLTADRPPRLRGTDANQTMDQIHLFGSHSRAFFDVGLPELDEVEFQHLRALACRSVAVARGRPPGPVHLNLSFKKPLQPTGTRPSPRPEGMGDLAWEGRPGGKPFVVISQPATAPSDGILEELNRQLAGSSRGVIVAGPHPDALRLGPAAVALSRATGFPLLADPLSGGKFTPAEWEGTLPGYDIFLRSPEIRKALVPDLILRLGAAPTSASLLHYLQEHGSVPQVVVDDGHRWKDHLATGHRFLQLDPTALLQGLVRTPIPPGEEGWLGRWVQVGRQTMESVRRADPGTLLEGEVLSRVLEAMPEEAWVMVGNSMPIREVDAFVPPLVKSLRLYGNRGTSGIDGLVSTTLGLGAARGRRVVGILGDLAFLHDMNGLLTLKREGFEAGFVVVNNDGGGIFHTLPIREHEPAFSRFFTTPHTMDLERVAHLHGILFLRVVSGEELSEALLTLQETEGSFLLEVRLPREESHEARRTLMEEIENMFQENELG